ncbi:unnamed protein product [Chrysoparadoxa australica]
MATLNIDALIKESRPVAYNPGHVLLSTTGVIFQPHKGPMPSAPIPPPSTPTNGSGWEGSSPGWNQQWGSQGQGPQQGQEPPPSKVEVSHILVKHQGSRNTSSSRDPKGLVIKNMTRQDARAVLADLLRRLQETPGNLREIFASIAMDRSDCSSAKRGGDLGWVQRGGSNQPNYRHIQWLTHRAQNAMRDVREQTSSYATNRSAG